MLLGCSCCRCFVLESAPWVLMSVSRCHNEVVAPVFCFLSNFRLAAPCVVDVSLGLWISLSQLRCSATSPWLWMMSNSCRICFVGVLSEYFWRRYFCSMYKSSLFLTMRLLRIQSLQLFGFWFNLFAQFPLRYLSPSTRDV